MLNITDKIFEMLLNDDTRYRVNAEKMDELKRLSTITKGATRPCYTSSNPLAKHHIKLLDMQRMLATVLSVEYMLEQDAVTIKEIFDYFKRYYGSTLKELKSLLITAITNGYLERKDD